MFGRLAAASDGDPVVLHDDTLDRTARVPLHPIYTPEGIIRRACRAEALYARLRGSAPGAAPSNIAASATFGPIPRDEGA
jgi:hypothetical protein